MGIEDELREISLKEPSELEGVAKQLFEDTDSNDGLSSIDMRTNLLDEEVGLCLINDIIFKQIGLSDLSPTRQFKRLASSRSGWKTEKFVQTASGVRDQRDGSGFMNKFSGMLGRRE
jgi:hypothetical protein